MQRKMLLYDKSGEEHFNLISALHKSVRSSDADAALYWLARMLEAGEDRLYIARRLMRMAIEDIGLADPRALEQAVAASRRSIFWGFRRAIWRWRRRRFIWRGAEVGRGVPGAGGDARGRGEDDRRAGADATAQRADAAHEGVGLRGRLPARAQVRRRHDRTWNACRHRWPGRSYYYPDRSRRGEADRASGWRRSGG